MNQKKKWGIALFSFFVGCMGLISLGVIANWAINYYRAIPEDCGMEDASAKYGPIKVGTEVILGRHREVNTTGQWVIVMSKWGDVSNTIQDYQIGREFPVEFINSKTEEGYFIFLIDYANGQWVVVMNKIDGYSKEYDWYVSEEFPESYINDMWDQNYDVTDIEYGDGKWAVVVSDSTKYAGQSYARRSTFNNVEEFIAEKEADKFYITDLEYGQGEWVALVSKGGSIQSQSWTETNHIFPNDFIELRKRERFYIFDIENRSGTWVLLTRRGTGHTDQEWFLSREFPAEKIEKYWDDGYFLTNASYGDIGPDNWTYEQNNYVGQTATVTKLDGVDKQGCPLVRVNLDRENWTWRIRDLTMVSNNSTPPEFIPSEYAENSGGTWRGEDAIIGLDDGARITVFSESFEQPVEALIERNPSKIASLPPLGDDVVQLSDFYNFQVTGELMGPVQIRIPFDHSLIPNSPGVLTIAYPTSNGWEFSPVSAYDGFVNFQTMELGDPLIAWHFVELDQINLEYEARQYCERLIPVQVTPAVGTWNTTFTLRGQVLSNDEFDSDVSHIGLVIKANYWKSPTGGSYYTTTDENGEFEISFSPDNSEFFSLSMDDINGFHVLAECDSPKGSFSSTSEGWTTFEIKGGQATGASTVASNPGQIKVDLTNNHCQAQDFYLDGKLLSTIKPGVTISFSTSEGEHSFQVCDPGTSSCGELISEYWSISRQLSISRGASCDAAQNPPSTHPTLYADQNYQCREGPDRAYGHVADIFQGTSYRIIGRASNGWYLVAIDLNTTSKKSCWIGGGVASGDLSTVEYFEVQPPAQANGTLPIYDLNSFVNNWDLGQVIGYLSCDQAASVQWDYVACGGTPYNCYQSRSTLFGYNSAVLKTEEVFDVCGFVPK